MEGTLAEIRLFAGAFAPKFWAYCQGQLLAINTNTALYSLLGTTFGGNGTSTFGLPDLRGRVALGTGQASYDNVTLGESGGANAVVLSQSNMPPHTHNLTLPNNSLSVNGTAVATMTVVGSGADSSTPVNTYLAEDQSFSGMYATTPTPGSTMNSGSIAVTGSTLGVSLPAVSLSPAGSNIPIDIHMPYLGMAYIICTQGIYPARN